MTPTHWPLWGPALRWAGLAGAVLAGTALQLQQPALWPAACMLALAAAALLLLLLLVLLLRVCLGAARARQLGDPVAPWLHTAPVWAGVMLVVAVLAFALTATRAQWRLLQALPAALEGLDLQMTGQVVSLPRETITGTRFLFQVEAAQHNGRPVQVPPLLSLGWYRAVDEDALLGGPPQTVKAGQRWRLTARLRQPHGTLNPHAFDLELWLFERGIRASGSVRATATARAELLPDDGGAPVQALRQRVRDAITLRVADPALAGVLAALAVGDQAAIERADWEVFRTTGVAHLMSISGLHVTMFAWLAGAVLGALWRLHPRAPLWLPAPQAARWGGLLAAAAYALVAGWGVPAQRTVWMLAAVVLLRSAGLRWPLWAVLLAAAVVVCVLDPWALLQPGFWLSFVAVALLASSEPAQYAAPGSAAAEPHFAAQRLRRWMQEGLRTQAVATVGLAPLSMLFFQQVSVVGFVANLVAIPVVTLVITPLALLGTLVPPLWALAAVVVQGLMQFLQVLSAWPWAVWTAAAAPPWAVACGLLAGVLAVAPLPPRLRLLALPLMLPLLAPPVARPAAGQFELVAADIGQGTAVLVRTRHHLLLYDSGPQYTRDSDAGARVLLPLLRARGEREVSLLMLSHRDTDHVGGAAAVLAGLPVRAMSSSLEPSHVLLAQGQALGVPHTPCHAGQRWQWDGVHFEVLHPRPADLALGQARSVKPNTLSCVLRVQAANTPATPATPAAPGRSVLLTGDIEAAQEAALVAAHSGTAALRGQMLLVPHHGSRTSSTADFIAAVQPQVAVVQAAYRSRFGHPAPDVVARYERQGIRLLRSDRCGALQWPAGADVDAVQCQRVVARRYWHHPGGYAGP